MHEISSKNANALLNKNALLYKTSLHVQLEFHEPSQQIIYLFYGFHRFG